MAFNARRLRVQLPCGDATVVDAQEDDAGAGCCFNTPPCATYFGTPSCGGDAGASAPPPPPPPPCGIPSPIPLPIMLAESDMGLVDAEYLPVLRMQLETRLQEIEVFAKEARKFTEGQLREVEAAEQAIKDQEAKE